MIKPILQYPDPILNQMSLDVVDFDENLGKLFQDMKDTLSACPNGIGLSAVQIGVLLKACVIKDGHNGFLEICNPVILEDFGDEYKNEGCLSCVGLEVPIHAPEDVTVEFFTPEKEYRKFSLYGVYARCIRHEMSHQ